MKRKQLVLSLSVILGIISVLGTTPQGTHLLEKYNFIQRVEAASVIDVSVLTPTDNPSAGTNTSIDVAADIEVKYLENPNYYVMLWGDGSYYRVWSYNKNTNVVNLKQFSISTNKITSCSLTDKDNVLITSTNGQRFYGGITSTSYTYTYTGDTRGTNNSIEYTLDESFAGGIGKYMGTSGTVDYILAKSDGTGGINSTYALLGVNSENGNNSYLQQVDSYTVNFRYIGSDDFMTQTANQKTVPVDSATLAPSAPDDLYGYRKFVGWDKALGQVSNSTLYTAKYEDTDLENTFWYDGIRYLVTNGDEVTVLGYNKEDVVIPESFTYNNKKYYVIKIAKYATDRYTSIKSLTVDSEILSLSAPSTALGTIDTYKTISPYKLKITGAYTISQLGNIPISEMDLSEYTGNSIPDKFLYYNDFVKNVKLSNTIKTIGNSAFNNCSKLGYLDLSNATKIGTAVVTAGSTPVIKINTSVSLTLTNFLSVTYYDNDETTPVYKYLAIYDTNMNNYQGKTLNGHSINRWRLKSGTSELSNIQSSVEYYADYSLLESPILTPSKLNPTNREGGIYATIS